MKKKIIRLSTGNLGVEFTKEEENKYGMIEGDVIDLDDMLIQKIRRKKYDKETKM